MSPKHLRSAADDGKPNLKRSNKQMTKGKTQFDELRVSLPQQKVKQRCETVTSPPLPSSLTKVTGLFSAWVQYDTLLTFIFD